MSAVAGQPITDAHDFFVPAFEVRLKGQDLPRDVIHDVLDVTYRDSLDRIDQVEITINNWDAATRTFKYSDPDGQGDSGPLPSFDPGAQLELSMGYRGDPELTLMLTGDIVSLTPTFPAQGAPTLQVRALSRLYRLQRKRTVRPFENKKDSAIARAIGDELGVDVRTVQSAEDDEHEHPYVLVNNQFPIIFLLGRARALGYDLYVDGDGALFFGPTERVRPDLKLEWGKSLVQFSPTLKTKGQVRKITVRGWDPTKSGDERAVVGEATWSDLATQALPSNEDLQTIDSALGESFEVVTDYVPRSKAEADRVARELLADVAKRMVTARGTTIGLPELRAGGALGIDGLGSRFSGRYVVTESTHTIGASGYRVEFTARMEIRRDGG